MEKKKLMMEGPISLGAFTLLPVSETTCIGEQIGGIVLFRFSKTPIAVVVISPTERKAFRITGEEISLAALTAEIPDVAMAISRDMGDTYGRGIERSSLRSQGVRKQDIAISCKCSDLATTSPPTPNFELVDPIPAEDC